jgi:hypothetical protein
VGAAYGILADMDLTDFLTLAKALAISIRLLQTEGESQPMELGLSRYDCAVFAVQKQAELSEIKAMLDEWLERRKSGELRAGVWLVYVVERSWLSLTAMPRRGRSDIEKLVDNFGKPSPVTGHDDPTGSQP